MRLNFGGDGVVTVGLRDCFRGGRCHAFQAGSIARLDFVAERRALAIGDSRVAGARRDAASCYRFDLDCREAGGAQIGLDRIYVMIPVWRSCQKAGRVARENIARRLGYDPGKVVILYAIPDVEEKAPAGTENAKSLLVTCNTIREEHDAELAAHGVEAFVLEGQIAARRLAST